MLQKPARSIPMRDGMNKGFSSGLHLQLLQMTARSIPMRDGMNKESGSPSVELAKLKAQT